MVNISVVDMSAALTVRFCWQVMQYRENLLETGAIFRVTKGRLAAQPPAPRSRLQGAISPFRMQLTSPPDKPVGKLRLSDHALTDLLAIGGRRGQHDPRRCRNIAKAHGSHHPSLT